MEKNTPPIILKDFTLTVYVQDRRCKTGKRLFNTYLYRNKHHQWMQEEMRDLASGLYPADRFSFVLSDAPAVV